MKQEATCRNRGTITNDADAVHGENILARRVRVQSELAASESFTKGTTLDVDFLLAYSPCTLTEANQINGAGP